MSLEVLVSRIQFGIVEFRKLGEIMPGDSSKGVRSFREDGREEALLFECTSDDSATVYRTRHNNIGVREAIKTLAKGESLGISVNKESSIRNTNTEYYIVTHR